MLIASARLGLLGLSRDCLADTGRVYCCKESMRVPVKHSSRTDSQRTHRAIRRIYTHKAAGLPPSSGI